MTCINVLDPSVISLFFFLFIHYYNNFIYLFTYFISEGGSDWEFHLEQEEQTGVPSGMGRGCVGCGGECHQIVVPFVSYGRIRAASYSSGFSQSARHK